MPTPTVTTTTTTTLSIKPSVRRRLLTELRTYAELKAQREALDLALIKHREAAEACRAEIGESSLALEGFKVTRVEPVRSILDKQKLVQQGVTTAQIEAATVVTPGKPYTKITCPGERNGEEY